MIPTNTVFDYSEEENLKMRAQVEDFIEIFNEVTNKIIALKENKKEANPKINPETNFPIPEMKEIVQDTNVFFINPSIKKEFLELQDKKMKTHEIFNKYEEWFEELWRLFVVNEGTTLKKREKMRDHVVEIYQVCATFPTLLEIVTKPPKQ